METKGKRDPVAPKLQQAVMEFLQCLGWDAQHRSQGTLEFSKAVAGGHQLSWLFRFEDEGSLSQAAGPDEFAAEVMRDIEGSLLFDLMLTDDAISSRRWKDDLAPPIDRRFQGTDNCRYGTLKTFLNRFAGEISSAYEKPIAEMLKGHFIQKPVDPSFVKAEAQAPRAVMEWIGSNEGSRILLLKGDAGSGKSVFSLMLVRELRARFGEEPSRYPAPFLIWFSNQRPPALNDLLTLTLGDLALSQNVTPEAVRYLIKRGRLILILDGFDEVSRALAQNAEQNVKELSGSINKDTSGRLILTSRPSFIEQEQIFADLQSECQEDVPMVKELAPYSDDQMHRWVLLNPPPDFTARPPEQHWQRVQTAFQNHPALRDLCRTPVFLRMLSEVLVKDRSVRSLRELLENFCRNMWERERGKRNLALSDDQYFYAYEAIALLAADEQRIAPKDVKVYLELYFQEYASHLVASLPEDTATLVADLAIGPMTYRNGIFAFVHEVLHGYFFSRLLARSLKTRGKRTQLWKRSIPDTVWRFLPLEVGEIFESDDAKEGLVREIAEESRSGLVAWNVAKAAGIPPTRVRDTLFAGKEVASLVCENADLSGVSFNNSTIYEVAFERCNLSQTTFNGARIKKVKFVACGEGALFDAVPLVDEDSEVTIVRAASEGQEVYVGKEISRILAELAGQPVIRSGAPEDLAMNALVVIFESLFKADRRRQDYPEKRKIENRLRAWLQNFSLTTEQSRALLQTLSAAVDDLKKEGWICLNPNRPRTLVPCPGRSSEVAQIIRNSRIEAHMSGLVKIGAQLKDRCNEIVAVH